MMSVSLYIFICLIYRSRAIYTDKYLNVKVVKNRICVGGECVCTSALITVPSLNLLTDLVLLWNTNGSICSLYSVQKSDQYLK